MKCKLSTMNRTKNINFKITRIKFYYDLQILELISDRVCVCVCVNPMQIDGVHIVDVCLFNSFALFEV